MVSSILLLPFFLWQFWYTKTNIDLIICNISHSNNQNDPLTKSKLKLKIKKENTDLNMSKQKKTRLI